MALVSVNEAVKILRNGGVVAMPTETVYGLAAAIDNPDAIRNIFETKQRPFFDPLIVHIHSLEQAKMLTSSWDNLCQSLATHFWPGPLTMVLPKSSLVSDMITSGLPSVGIRMPKHSLALELLRAINIPLAAPSANKFGRTSPTMAVHVESEFNSQVAVIDGGACEIGLESTVLLVRRDHTGRHQLAILREGGVTRSEIENFLHSEGFAFQFQDQVSKKESPGHMKHHYMPKVPLILVHDKALGVSQVVEKVGKLLPSLPEEVEGVKLIKPTHISNPAIMSLSQEAAVAARQLYAELRRISENGHDLLIFYVEDFHKTERFNALMDRLSKAASLIL